jgi:DnaJ family protein C protein 7
MEKASTKLRDALSLVERALVVAPHCRKVNLLKVSILLQLKAFDECLSLCCDLVPGALKEGDSLSFRPVKWVPSSVGNLAEVDSDLLLLYSKAQLYSGNLDSSMKLLRSIFDVQGAATFWPTPALQSFSKKVKRIWTDKTEGNHAYKAGKFDVAFKKYTAALSIEKNAEKLNATLFCNRAAASMKMKSYDQAIRDCNKGKVLTNMEE